MTDDLRAIQPPCQQHDWRSSRKGAFERWLPAAPNTGHYSAYTHDNDVTAYVEVADYYEAAGAAINATSGSGAQIFIGCWLLDLDTPMSGSDAGATLESLLARAASRGVSVYVLLSGHINHCNTDVARRINSYHGCCARVDSRLLVAGCFHQKILAVSAADGVVAFVGGMDLEGERLGVRGRGPWHDVQIKLVGSAACQVASIFADQWESLGDHATSAHRVVRSSIGSENKSRGGKVVQVACTYGNPQRKMLIPPPCRTPYAHRRSDKWLHEFRFAPEGDSRLHDLMVHAICATRESIYVEDQYFVLAAELGGETELLDALASTIAKPTFRKMIVLTSSVGAVQPDLYQVNRRRRQLWDHLVKRFPDRVQVWAYKQSQGRVSWLHAKAWIFDDEFAIIGSGNFSRRSLSSDGELGVGIYGAGTNGSSWAKDLRIALWLKHLQADERQVRSSEIHDFVDGASRWRHDGEGHLSNTYLRRLDLSLGDSDKPDRLVLCGDGSRVWAAGLINTVVPARLLSGLSSAPLGTWDGQWDLIDPDGS